jgi:hypothetical protein
MAVDGVDVDIDDPGEITDDTDEDGDKRGPPTKIVYCGFDMSTWVDQTEANVRRDAARWRACQNPTQRDNMSAQTGVRFSELQRLPYFDPVRMTVVDPMHCLFLGLVKALMVRLRALGILTDAMLTEIQAEADCMCVPRDLGRIPRKLGSKMSGMTAHQWKNFMTVFARVLLTRHIWPRGAEPDTYVPLSEAECKDVKRQIHGSPGGRPGWDVARLKSELRQRGLPVSGPKAELRARLCEFICGNAADCSRGKNVYRLVQLLSCVCDGFTRRNQTVHNVEKTHEILVQYCKLYEHMFGAQACTVNVHMSCHLRDCILDFGSVVGFWLFGFERYNGILQGLNSNCHDISSSFMHMFTSQQRVMENDNEVEQDEYKLRSYPKQSGANTHPTHTHTYIHTHTHTCTHT